LLFFYCLFRVSDEFFANFREVGFHTVSGNSALLASLLMLLILLVFLAAGILTISGVFYSLMLSLLLASLQLLASPLLLSSLLPLAFFLLPTASVPANRPYFSWCPYCTVQKPKGHISYRSNGLLFFLPSDYRNIGPSLAEVGTSNCYQTDRNLSD
jgi:hypothetical protein